MNPRFLVAISLLSATPARADGPFCESARLAYVRDELERTITEASRWLAEVSPVTHWQQEGGCLKLRARAAGEAWAVETGASGLSSTETQRWHLRATDFSVAWVEAARAHGEPFNEAWQYCVATAGVEEPCGPAPAMVATSVILPGRVGTTMEVRCPGNYRTRVPLEDMWREGGAIAIDLPEHERCEATFAPLLNVQYLHAGVPTVCEQGASGRPVCRGRDEVAADPTACGVTTH